MSRSHGDRILRVSEATVDVADLRRAGSSDAADRADDAPLRDDIRLLGRVLGEVIGEQAGPDVLDLVESTRVEAFKIRRSRWTVRSWRSGWPGSTSGRPTTSSAPSATSRCWPTWPRTSTTSGAAGSTGARARHRRRAASPPRSSCSTRPTCRRRRRARARRGAGLPVVTAHPTEVRRKTISDVQRQVTELIRQRDRTAVGEDRRRRVVGQALAVGPHPLADGAAAAVAAAADRRDRRGAALLRPVAVRRRPALNELRRALNERWPDAGLLSRPMLLPGSWIGGDRDGNPFVTADALRRATTRQAETALIHHLGELELLRDELSMSDRLVTPTPELYHLAEASRDDSPFPRRPDLNGIAARLAATAARCSAGRPRAGHPRRAAALRLARRAARRPRRHRHLVAATGPGRWPTTACAACARRWRCSASTCAGWTCGRTPPSTSRWWGSCWRGPACATTTPASTSRPGWSCWPVS